MFNFFFNGLDMIWSLKRITRPIRKSKMESSCNPVFVKWITSRFIKWIGRNCNTRRIKLLCFLLVSVKSRIDVVHGPLFNSLTVVIIQVGQLWVCFFIKLFENCIVFRYSFRIAYKIDWWWDENWRSESYHFM